MGIEKLGLARIVAGLVFIFSIQSFAANKRLPDNSAVNTRDREVHQLTADQQSSSTSDTELTRLIRQAVVGHDELSVYAHNVKIITTDGFVTLKGPVRSAAEVATIQKIATSFVGKTNVKNEMEIVKGE